MIQCSKPLFTASEADGQQYAAKPCRLEARDPGFRSMQQRREMRAFQEAACRAAANPERLVRCRLALRLQGASTTALCSLQSHPHAAMQCWL